MEKVGLSSLVLLARVGSQTDPSPCYQCTTERVSSRSTLEACVFASFLPLFRPVLNLHASPFRCRASPSRSWPEKTPAKTSWRFTRRRAEQCSSSTSCPELSAGAFDLTSFISLQLPHRHSREDGRSPPEDGRRRPQGHRSRFPPEDEVEEDEAPVDHPGLARLQGVPISPRKGRPTPGFAYGPSRLCPKSIDGR